MSGIEWERSHPAAEEGPLFPRADEYVQFISNPARGVCERHQRFPHRPFMERHLQCVWYDARWRPAHLITSTGEFVHVHDPGIWNREAGPDFIGASLCIRGECVRGDVEVHIRPSDWIAHGHTDDPLYRNVRLHVTYYPARAGEFCHPPGAAHIALQNALTAQPWFSFDAIELAAYPAAARAVQPPCRHILDGWNWDRKAALLEAAGE
jgi:hypothetical protein